jgi:hypothetical protein
MVSGIGGLLMSEQILDLLDKWNLMPNHEQDFWLATNVLNYSVVSYDNYSVQSPDGSHEGFTPTLNINHAMILANHLGIALIPQSNGYGFSWYACDLESVGYRGEEIIVRPLGDASMSAETPEAAICAVAFLSTELRRGD